MHELNFSPLFGRNTSNRRSLAAKNNSNNIFYR